MHQALANPKPDPMGLNPLRRMLHAEAGKRWMKAAQEVKRAIVAKDVLGLKAQPEAISVGDKAEAFGRWLGEKLSAHVGDGWMSPYIAAAQDRATDDAKSRKVCCEATEAAQAGIRDAVSRDALAAVAAGLMSSHRQASRIAAPVEAALAGGLRRTRYLGEHAISQAYVQAQLDGLERSGVKFVNTKVEPKTQMDALFDEEVDADNEVIVEGEDGQRYRVFKLGNEWAVALADAYDPDEPRDERGRWAETWYHGTREITNVLSGEPLFLTTDRHQAHGAGGASSSTRPAGGTVRIRSFKLKPGKVFDGSSIMSDAEEEGTDWLAAEAEVIRQAKATGARYADFDHPNIDSQDYHRVRIVLYPHDDLIEGDLADAYDPDEPRDDRGRWTEGLESYRLSYSDPKRIGQYNPKFYRKEIDQLTDDDGKVVGEKDKLVHIREAQTRLPLEEAPSLMYRGMSNAEYEAFKATGEIKSLGGFNIGESQKGLTYWTSRPSMAESYSSGFAPREFKPDWDRPAYVVVAKRAAPERIAPQVKGTDEAELGVIGLVPREDVVEVWRGNVIERDPGYADKYGSLSPSSTLHWHKLAHVGDAGPPDEPRDPQGKWTAESINSDPSDSDMKRYGKQIDARIASTGDDEAEGYSEAEALAHMDAVLRFDKNASSSQRRWLLTSYAEGPDGKLAAAGLATFNRAKRVATIEHVGSVQHGAGAAVVKHLLGQIKQAWQPQSVELITQVPDYWRRFGFSPVPGADDDLGIVTMRRVGDALDLDDAARKNPQPKHPKTGKFAKKHVVARELRRDPKTGRFRAAKGLKPLLQVKAEAAEKAFAKAAETVKRWDVQTANDDKVCKRCQEISDNGPYKLSTARSLIPAHPNCRCVFVPAGELEDALPIDGDRLTAALSFGHLEPA